MIQLKSTNQTIFLKYLYKFCLVLILIFNLISCDKPTKLNSQTKNYSDNKDSYINSKSYSDITLPNKITFCGENIPLYDNEVRERFEREFYLTLQQPGQIILYLKRSGHYFPTFEKIINQYNMHQDIKYISVAESALFMTRSNKGAVGLWQFMPETAKNYGLEINTYVDERKHILKSTIAAMKYLKTSYERLNSWVLAAASYNMGLGGLIGDMSYQKESSYFDLYLNDETSRYIFRILAIKEIMEHPDKYGFNIKNKDKYNVYNTKQVYVNYNIINLAEWSKNNYTTYKNVKTMNPWLISNKLVTNGKSYQIEINKN